MNDEYQSMAANGICHAATMASSAVQACAVDVMVQMMRPSAIYRPAMSKDGNQWCALYGDNLQDGVAGFGDTPEKAMADFDKNWSKP